MNTTAETKALNYHCSSRPGKTEIIPTKPYCTPEDLALAYSPGVAYPALSISKERWKAYSYTNKGNLVAVISNGSAIMGLGNQGALASKPVMEGKSMLFKIYADIDAFDIEIGESNAEKIVETIAAISPTFGAINLEDIKSPDCFYIEKKLRKLLDIPVMHDDQHGTAVTVAAAIMNAVEVAGKELNNINIVINGAGAAAISTARMLTKIGIQNEQITMLDSHGVVSAQRLKLTAEKREFATKRINIETLTQAVRKADVFIGLSRGNVMGEEELMEMNKRPIIFALANPVPEIDYKIAKSIRPDAILATGRTDTPNQLNNVLAFPYLFRGALDTCATCINEEMKVAAAKAIALLAHRPTPLAIEKMYNSRLEFGTDYLLPKPNDRRLLTEVSTAVAQAAIGSGVARRKITDWDQYRHVLLDGIEREARFCREIYRHHKKPTPHRFIHPIHIM